MNENYEDIEYIKIINNTTNELIATIFHLEGKFILKTELPYRNIIKYMEETKEIVEKEERK